MAGDGNQKIVYKYRTELNSDVLGRQLRGSLDPGLVVYSSCIVSGSTVALGPMSLLVGAESVPGYNDLLVSVTTLENTSPIQCSLSTRCIVFTYTYSSLSDLSDDQYYGHFSAEASFTPGVGKVMVCRVKMGSDGSVVAARMDLADLSPSLAQRVVPSSQGILFKPAYPSEFYMGPLSARHVTSDFGDNCVEVRHGAGGVSGRSVKVQYSAGVVFSSKFLEVSDTPIAIPASVGSGWLAFGIRTRYDSVVSVPSVLVPEYFPNNAAAAFTRESAEDAVPLGYFHLGTVFWPGDSLGTIDSPALYYPSGESPSASLVTPTYHASSSPVFGPASGTETWGHVKLAPDSNLNLSNTGLLSSPRASDSTFGSVKVVPENGLAISEGLLSLGLASAYSAGAMTSGEKGSVASAVSHMANRSNPHGVNTSQMMGAGSLVMSTSGGWDTWITPALSVGRWAVLTGTCGSRFSIDFGSGMSVVFGVTFGANITTSSSGIRFVGNAGALSSAIYSTSICGSFAGGLRIFDDLPSRSFSMWMFRYA